MDWLKTLLLESGVAHSVLLLAVVIVIGMSLGKIKFFGIGLGMAGALFAGIAIVYLGGIFGMAGMGDEILLFCREFGLILFVYTIGMQVGPGFIDSMKREGLPINILAAVLVIMGVLVSVVISWTSNLSIPVILGLYSGATTNTPSLGAGGQAVVQTLQGACQNSQNNCQLALQKVGFTLEQSQSLWSQIHSSHDLKTFFKVHIADFVTTLDDQALAIAYPFGILGVILVMIAAQWFFRIKIDQEKQNYNLQTAQNVPSINSVNMIVENHSIVGKTIGDLIERHGLRIVISRIKKHEQIYIPTPETALHLGDRLLVVGDREEIDRVLELVGIECHEDLRQDPHLTTRNIVVTRPEISGQRIIELNWEVSYGAIVTRVTRGEFRFLADPHSVSLHLGDVLRVVGSKDALEQVAKQVGNSEKQLAHPEVLPLFLGISLGVIFGSIPFFIPGIPAPVKLGLAGGPMLIAILLARFRKIGSLNFYLPLGANLILREIGIVFFLACVGIKAGESFVQVILYGDGLKWMAYGSVITLIPVIVAIIIGRKFLGLNYLSLMGVISGSMTSPPTLAYANSISGSEAPSIAYASVYPLTMLLRIMTAQIMAILLLSF